jgi:hypothetical protein
MAKKFVSPSGVGILTAIFCQGAPDVLVGASPGIITTSTFPQTFGLAPRSENVNPISEVQGNLLRHFVEPLFVLIEVDHENHMTRRAAFHHGDMIGEKRLDHLVPPVGYLKNLNLTKE